MFCVSSKSENENWYSSFFLQPVWRKRRRMGLGRWQWQFGRCRAIRCWQYWQYWKLQGRSVAQTAFPSRLLWNQRSSTTGTIRAGEKNQWGTLTTAKIQTKSSACKETSRQTSNAYYTTYYLLGQEDTKNSCQTKGGTSSRRWYFCFHGVECQAKIFKTHTWYCQIIRSIRRQSMGIQYWIIVCRSSNYNNNIQHFVSRLKWCRKWRWLGRRWWFEWSPRWLIFVNIKYTFFYKSRSTW